MADAVAGAEGFTVILDALTMNLDVDVHLYTGTTILDEDTVASDFTELSYSGYSPLPITGWTAATIAGGVAVAVGGPVVFTYTTGTPPPPVYGVFITKYGTGEYLWGWERPGGPFDLGNDFPELRVTVALRHPPA